MGPERLDVYRPKETLGPNLTPSAKINSKQNRGWPVKYKHYNTFLKEEKNLP